MIKKEELGLEDFDEKSPDKEDVIEDEDEIEEEEEESDF